MKVNSVQNFVPAFNERFAKEEEHGDIFPNNLEEKSTGQILRGFVRDGYVKDVYEIMEDAKIVDSDAVIFLSEQNGQLMAHSDKTGLIVPLGESSSIESLKLLDDILLNHKFKEHQALFGKNARSGIDYAQLAMKKTFNEEKFRIMTRDAKEDRQYESYTRKLGELNRKQREQNRRIDEKKAQYEVLKMIIDSKRKERERVHVLSLIG